MSKRAASPSQKRNTWRQRREPGPRSASRRGAESSRAPRSRDGLRGSGSARGPALPGLPGGPRRADGFRSRGCRCRPWLPRAPGAPREPGLVLHAARVPEWGGHTGCFPRASPSRRPALKSSHPYFGPAKPGQRWCHRGPVPPAGWGCSGRGGPGNGLAARVPFRRPRGTAMRDRRFSFFFSTLIQSILPPRSRNPPPGRAPPAGCRPAACARRCTSPARRSPAAGSLGFVSHIYFRLGKLGLAVPK